MKGRQTIFKIIELFTKIISKLSLYTYVMDKTTIWYGSQIFLDGTIRPLKANKQR